MSTPLTIVGAIFCIVSLCLTTSEAESVIRNGTCGPCTPCQTCSDCSTKQQALLGGRDELPLCAPHCYRRQKRSRPPPEFSSIEECSGRDCNYDQELASEESLLPADDPAPPRNSPGCGAPQFVTCPCPNNCCGAECMNQCGGFGSTRKKVKGRGNQNCPNCRTARSSQRSCSWRTMQYCKRECMNYCFCMRNCRGLGAAAPDARSGKSCGCNQPGQTGQKQTGQKPPGKKAPKRGKGKSHRRHGWYY